MYVSNPSAALMHILDFVAQRTVGSHRLSRVSMSRNTASWSLTNFSRVCTSERAFAMDLAVCVCVCVCVCACVCACACVCVFISPYLKQPISQIEDCVKS